MSHKWKQKNTVMSKQKAHESIQEVTMKYAVYTLMSSLPNVARNTGYAVTTTIIDVADA